MSEKNTLGQIEVGVGDIVKIRLTNGDVVERVWAIVQSVDVERQEATVEINNHPISPEFKFGETVTVPARFILEVANEPRR